MGIRGKIGSLPGNKAGLPVLGHQKAAVSRNIDPLGIHLVPLGQQVQPRVFSVQVQIHPPAFRRVGRPHGGGSVQNNFVAQVTGIVGIRQQDPFFCLAHAQKVGSVRKGHAVWLFGRRPCGLSPPAYGFDPPGIVRASVGLVDPDAAGLAVVKIFMNIVHAAGSHVQIDGRHIPRPDKGNASHAVPRPVRQIVGLVQNQTAAGHAVGQHRAVQRQRSLSADPESGLVQLPVGRQEKVAFPGIRLPAGDLLLRAAGGNFQRKDRPLFRFFVPRKQDQPRKQQRQQYDKSSPKPHSFPPMKPVSQPTNTALFFWGLSENRKHDQQQGIFRLMKPFFRRNTLCIARKNGAQQAEKTRCLGVLMVFR